MLHRLVIQRMKAEQPSYNFSGSAHVSSTASTAKLATAGREGGSQGVAESSDLFETPDEPPNSSRSLNVGLKRSSITFAGRGGSNYVPKAGPNQVIENVPAKIDDYHDQYVPAVDRMKLHTSISIAENFLNGVPLISIHETVGKQKQPPATDPYRARLERLKGLATCAVPRQDSVGSSKKYDKEMMMEEMDEALRFLTSLDSNPGEDVAVLDDQEDLKKRDCRKRPHFKEGKKSYLPTDSGECSERTRELGTELRQGRLDGRANFGV